MAVARVGHAIGFGRVLLVQVTAVVHDHEHFADAEVFLGDPVHVNEIAQTPAQPDQAVVVTQRLVHVLDHDARQILAVPRGEAGQRAGKTGIVEKRAVEARREHHDFARGVFREHGQKIAGLGTIPDDPALWFRPGGG